MLSLCRLIYCLYCDARLFLLIPSLRLRLAALQTSLLFSKDYGLLSFLRKSLGTDEVDIKEHPVNHNLVKLKGLMLTETSVFQFRDTRVEILCFLEKFLDRVSPRVKGWEKTYAIDIRVSSPFRTRFFFPEERPVRQGKYHSENKGKIITCNDNTRQACIHVIPHINYAVCSPHVFFMQDTCMAVYTKDKVAKCRTPVLDLLIKVGVSWHLMYFL